jgi:Domain of unknown function (DUF4864)
MEFEECASISLRQLPVTPHRTRRREREGMCQFSTSRHQEPSDRDEDGAALARSGQAIWDGVAKFAVVLVRPMIARLGIASGSLCLAWMMAGSGLVGAQPWQPRDPEPPPDLPATTGLTHADEAAMRLLIEAQIAAMRADDWPSAFALESPALQAQYGTPAALRDDVAAHYPPFPAIASVHFLDIVTFRGLPTYRVTLADGEGATTTAYYLVRRLGDGSLRIAGCVLVRVPST